MPGIWPRASACATNSHLPRNVCARKTALLREAKNAPFLQVAETPKGKTEGLRTPGRAAACLALAESYCVRY